MKPFRYVALIGIDGMGNFNRQASTPQFDRIFAEGAVTFDALSLDPTISAENWGGMLLGADPTVHGLTNSIVGSNEYHNTALPSLFTRIRRAMPEAYLSSCVNWNPINHGIVEHNVGVTLKTAENDEKLLPLILEEVAKKPTFLFVQLDDADGAGHGNGYGSPAHLAQITREDAYVGQIFDAYCQAGIAEDTLFAVIADHGGYDHGHGGYSDTEKFIFFGAAGREVQKGNIGYMQTKDAASVVLAALGIPLPAQNDKGFSAEVPDGLFKGIAGQHRTLVMKEYKKHLPCLAPQSEQGLFAFVDRKKLACAFDFEGNTADIAHNLAVTKVNNIKYYNTGVRGECGELGQNGYAVTAPVPLQNGFTLAVWIRKDTAHHDDVVIVTNKVRDNDRIYGFGLNESIHDAKFILGNGTQREHFTVAFPTDMKSGWVHFAASFDNRSCEVRLYLNFKLVNTHKADESFRNIDYTAPLYIGEDATGNFNHSNNCNTVVDDLLVFGAVLTEEEIARLGAYYGE